MARIIAVVSGKGGVGKTTFCINLSYVLSNYFKRRVLLIDTNFTSSHVGISLGLYYPEYNLNKLLRNECTPEQAVHNYYKSMDILPLSMSIRDLENVNITLLPNFVRKFDEKYDFIILDSAPGLGREAITSIQSCDEVIYVTNPFLISAIDISRVQEVVRELNKKEVGIVINMWRKNIFELNEKDILNIFGGKVIGRIDYDERFLKAAMHKLPATLLYPNSNFTKQYLEIASKITGEIISIRKNILDYLFFWRK